MTVLVIGLVFVVLATLAYVALRNAQDFSDANEIIPGVATNAPKAWAGAHSVEARLHRPGARGRPGEDPPCQPSVRQIE